MDARELIRTWTAGTFRLEVYDTHTQVSSSHWRLAYVLYDGDTVMFAGDDFGCPKTTPVDADAVIRSLVTFLTMQPGDKAPDYFAHYASEQRAWRDSDRPQLLRALVQQDLGDPWDTAAVSEASPDTPRPRFPLGHVVATPGALAALAEAGEDPATFLDRHTAGDWGDLCEEDRQANETALQTGARLFSAYQTAQDVKLWIITEADRRATCLLLPSEY
jgi:hypothetical protein